MLMSHHGRTGTAEREKWDRYYASIPINDEDAVTKAFNEQFAEAVTELVPPDGKILEAGCGAGWQSLSLVRRGYDTTLMDFSREALSYSRRLFERENLSASFVLQDATQEGRPDHDLVFNVGVLEHYTFDEQVQFLRGMASRSRGLVLALVPNRLCYWYWVWRMQTSASGDWAWGKEVPVQDLSAVFAAAGLRFLGQKYFGQDWTEHFISTTATQEPLLGTLLKIHRSPIIEPRQAAYLVAAVGAVEGSPTTTLAGWSPPDHKENLELAELAAALADSLAQNSALNRQLSVLGSERAADREEVEQLRSEHTAAETTRTEVLNGLSRYTSQFEGTLSTYRNQRAWQLMLLFRKLYTELFREGWPGKRRLMRFALRLPFDGIPSLAPYDLEFPSVMSEMPLTLAKSLQGGPSPPAIEQAPRMSLPRSSPEQYDVIVLPVFEFDFRFQRPQQLIKQFGLNGHRVFWVSPSRRPAPKCARPYELVPLIDNVWEVHLQRSGWDIYGGNLSEADVRDAARALDELYNEVGIGANVVLLQLPFWRRLGLALRDEQDARVLFDCMDDWDAFPEIGDFNHTEQELLVNEADLLMVTSRRLHQRYADRDLSATLVRNGVDFDLFSSTEASDQLASYRRPFIGYVGAIADWFDFALVCEVARLRPQYSFVLVGGLGLEQDLAAEVASRFEGIPNIYLLGHKPYAEIPSLLLAFDVCMIPFVLNPVTEATDPVKLYEYFSLGKPVVATEMPELSQCSDLLYTASDSAAFAASLDEALNEPDGLRERRIAFASANTWLNRYHAIDRAAVEVFDTVSVIIVSHNSATYLPLCLDSLRSKTSYPNVEFIAVDNGSSDDSAGILQEYAARDDRIRLLLLQENTGFAKANNLGVEAAHGKYLVLLNADTIVTSNWLNALLRHCRLNQDLGMVLPVTNWAGNEARIDVAYQDRTSMEEFARVLARTKKGAIYPLEVGPLFCALIPRDVWDDIGNLDERFSIGMFEDDDYSLRMRQAGYRIAAAEDCFIHHFGNGSFGQMDQDKYEEIFQQNLRSFEHKWRISWQPHLLRPGVSADGTRLTPADLS